MCYMIIITPTIFILASILSMYKRCSGVLSEGFPVNRKFEHLRISICGGMNYDKIVIFL